MAPIWSDESSTAGGELDGESDGKDGDAMGAGGSGGEAAAAAVGCC